MINDIEIMSPVGSWEALAAALQAGAGSVYFGVGELNMRSKSTFNFTLGDLRTIAGACRRGWVSTQLTGVEIVAGMCIECPAVFQIS